MSNRLGSYELRGELGRGAMAIVWRGWDTKLEREVAIKEPVLPATADAAAVEELSERFIREARAAAALHHPGIVSVFAADVFDGRPAIVMEVIDGETLGDALARGPLEPASAMAVLDQLLEAVSFAHEHGVVHRDIKPDNIFLTRDGRVKLADFGLAQIGGSSALTVAGTVMGTPGYMAPEQVTGSAVDARADIFAIGSVAYEMLSGRNAFGGSEGVTPVSIMYRIVHEQPVAIPVLSPDSAHMPGVIAKALAKDPDQRHQSAAEMRSALRAGVGPEPHATAEVQPGSGRWIAMIAAVLTCVLLVLFVLGAARPPTGGLDGGLADAEAAQEASQQVAAEAAREASEQAAADAARIGSERAAAEAAAAQAAPAAEAQAAQAAAEQAAAEQAAAEQAAAERAAAAAAKAAADRVAAQRAAAAAKAAADAAAAKAAADAAAAADPTNR